MRQSAQRRRKLFEENPHCYYCGQLTRLVKGPKLPRDAATVEHLFPRLHPLRRAPNSTNEKRLVNACAGCNNDKSVRDQLDFVGAIGVFLRSMGKKNWGGWTRSVLNDLNRFDCF